MSHLISQNAAADALRSKSPKHSAGYQLRRLARAIGKLLCLVKLHQERMFFPDWGTYTNCYRCERCKLERFESGL
jgi:hypothetical protein